jgi:hypothetical protein
LSRVVGERAVVHLVTESVSVRVGYSRSSAEVTTIAGAISIYISLVRVIDRWTVVAEAPMANAPTDAIPVRVAAHRGDASGRRLRADIPVGTGGSGVAGKAVKEAG